MTKFSSFGQNVAQNVGPRDWYSDTHSKVFVFHIRTVPSKPVDNNLCSSSLLHLINGTPPLKWPFSTPIWFIAPSTTHTQMKWVNCLHVGIFNKLISTHRRHSNNQKDEFLAYRNLLLKYFHYLDSTRSRSHICWICCWNIWSKTKRQRPMDVKTMYVILSHGNAPLNHSFSICKRNRPAIRHSTTFYQRSPYLSVCLRTEI